jgi:hypothetical protein
MSSDNVVGTAGRLFAEQAVSPDEKSFMVDNTSAEYYKTPYYKEHQYQLLAVPTPRVSPPRITLEDVLGAANVEQYVKAKRISFHATGDTGASRSQAIPHEASVADAIAARASLTDAPAFLFHLGDIVYNFGEVEYYYDQFYEPFRLYDRPIFAIPGNHDGNVKYGPASPDPLYPSLFGYLRNFCTEQPARSPDAAGLVRSTMTQPGPYFTLDAPFVSIIGLYTNVLEGPGVISSQNGAYPVLDETQVDFLSAELERLAPERKQRQRAIVLACHHPPASADLKHGGSTGLSGDIDRACAAAGFLPDVVLSGHAHLYQRFTRATGGRTIPYIVSGSGGTNISKPPGEVLGKAPLTWGEFTLVKDPLLEYGYLTVTVDVSTAGAETLRVSFSAPANPLAQDDVIVDLASGSVVSPAARS